MSRYLTLAAACVFVSGCGGAEADGGAASNEDGVARIVIDAMGARHELERPARRVVSLVPSATETLWAIGSLDVLVGRTDYDTQGWAAEIPSVGGGLEPNLEALVALRPDVVIRFGGEQDPRTPERLDDLGIRHVAVRPVALADLFETNRIVGELVGREEESDALSREIRAGLDRLEAATSSLPRVRVAYLLGGSPPWVSGPDTYISEILDLVGGDNVFSDLRAPYAAVSPEELRSRDLDVVIVSGVGAFDESLTPNARIEVVGDDLEVPGPGVVAAARRIAEVLHARPIG